MVEDENWKKFRSALIENFDLIQLRNIQSHGPAYCHEFEISAGQWILALQDAIRRKETENKENV